MSFDAVAILFRRMFQVMPSPLWIGVGVVGAMAIAIVIRTLLVIRRYRPHIERVFDERPVFSVKPGVRPADSHDVEFTTGDGVRLSGSYLRSERSRSRGLILFCHEFSADRWSGEPYWRTLRTEGFDVFAFDFRNHGASDSMIGYTPRHWVSWCEVHDVEAAIRCARQQPDAGRLPLGVIGVSRGGGAAIGAAACCRDVQAIVTDGAFPTHGTMTSYMRKWVKLYGGERSFFDWLPDWYYGLLRDRVLARIARRAGCRFPKLERLIARISPRPLLMIHGGRDSYIRPEIAKGLFECAGTPKDLWVVHGAKHNAAVETAAAEYAARLTAFFEQHLRATSPIDTHAA